MLLFFDAVHLLNHQLLLDFLMVIIIVNILEPKRSASINKIITNIKKHTFATNEFEFKKSAPPLTNLLFLNLAI